MISLINLLYKYKIDGLKAFIKLKLGYIDYYKFKDPEFITIYIPKYKQPIFLRQKTTDQGTFKQIFISKEYDINYSFLPQTIIDAGANVGLAAVYFSQRYPKATIYSIEPEASNITILRKNVESYKNVVCLPNALHHTADETLEVVDLGTGNWGFITKSASEVTDVGSIISSIQTISIRAIIETYNITVIDILKIDIEGAEMELFESGYEFWLPKTRCVIIELHERTAPGCEDRVFSAINKFKFKQFKHGENWVFINLELENLNK